MSGKDFWTAFAPVLGLLILFSLAFFSVYRKEVFYAKSPSIDLISSNQIVTDQVEVPITGIVKNTSTLTVGGKQVPISSDGGFSAVVPVNLGGNQVEIVAVNSKKSETKQNISITREQPQAAVIATTNTGTGLTPSGPVESMVGSFGLAAIAVSLIIYRRSLGQKALQKA
jgi:hypothetical protein